MRWGRGTVAAVASIATVAGLASACSGGEQVASIGYAFDGPITTYNAGTTAGATSGALAALGRTLTGMSYTGPDGNAIADTDFGTATLVPGNVQTVQYRLDPDGVYSDGVPITCDDLVLAFVAHNGRATRAGGAPMFDAASTAGYADIDRVECQPGAKDATVVFRPGRAYEAWRTLFGATDVMPAHIAARVAGVDNVVSVVQAGDQDALGRIADFWNTGWDLRPDAIDTSLLPSSGPYKIDSYSPDGGLVLVANDRWWGDQPATPRIVVWPKNTDLKQRIADGAVQVLDVGAGSVPDLDLTGLASVNVPSRSAEQLVLATGGVFASADARRAFALCAPRQKLFADLGHPGFDATSGLGAGVLNSRLVQADSLLYGPVSAEGGRYPGGDAPAATAALAAAGAQNPTVRIGYLAPDDRRAKTVAAIAEACRPAGITVNDAASADFSPSALRAGGVDAVLAGTASRPGAAGSAVDSDAEFALRGGIAVNFGGFANPRYDELVDRLAIETNPDAQLTVSMDAENLLWGEMPSIPLFNEPRTIAFAEGMTAGVVNPTKAGAGWNMDRWVLKR